jgi:phage terminase large subunit-like protein
VWADEQVVAGRAAVAHVNECPRREAGEGCEDCRSAIESLTHLIPTYDPWADPDGSSFDYLRARSILGFYRDHLVFIEGEKADQPFVLEPWQAAVVANVFGWVRPSGIRRYREFFLFVAAKNGKSPLLAGMALYLLLCDGEPGAQVYFAAADKDQAALLFRWAAGMVFKNPEFGGGAGDLCQVHKAWKSIQVDSTMSVLRTLSSDADTKHGLNAHGVFVDELHAHHDRTLFDVLKTRTSSRRQPLIGVITTSDYERPSICNENYHYACKVRDGTISAPSYLPVIYEADAKDDIQSPATWRKANPNLGVSVREDALREESARALHSPGYRDEFLRTNLNVRTNAKESAIDPARWGLCVTGAEPGSLRAMRYDELRRALLGRRCFGGLDLSSTRDLASFALYFPEVMAALWWHWIPRDSARERQQRDRVPYLQWARDGALCLTGSGPDERTVDYGAIRAEIARQSDAYDLQEIAFDRWGANETVTALRDVHGIRVLQFGQGFGREMVAATKEFDRLVSSTSLAHGSDPVATWASSNLVWATDDAGNWKPSKRKSTERIDPMAAVIMAIGASLLAPPVAPAPTVEFVPFHSRTADDLTGDRWD